jgi:hypothetical protein
MEPPCFLAFIILTTVTHLYCLLPGGNVNADRSDCKLSSHKIANNEEEASLEKDKEERLTFATAKLKNK